MQESYQSFKKPLDLNGDKSNDGLTSTNLRDDALKIGLSNQAQKPDTATTHLPSVTITGLSGLLGLSGRVADHFGATSAALPPSSDGKADDKGDEKPAKPKTQITVGETFAYQNGYIKFLASDSTGNLAIVKHPGAPVGEPKVITETRQNIASNYTTVALDDRYVYVDKNGQVFESIGNSQFKQVQGVSGIASEKLPVKVPKPSYVEEDKFADAFDLRRGKWKDTQASDKVDGQAVVVKAHTNGMRRNYSVNGQEYELKSKGGLWYSHQDMEGPQGPIKKTDGLKLHVTIGDTDKATASEDLKRVQAALIPALEEATKKGGKLYGKVWGYKTLDPMFGLDKHWGDKEPYNTKRSIDNRVEPGSTGQEAKGFTIYPASDEHAKEIADFCAGVLKDKKLAFDGPRQTGNVGDKFADSDTHRVSVEKDYWKGYEVGTPNNRYYAAAIDTRLESAMRTYAERKTAEGASDWGRFKEKGVYDGDPKLGRLSADALSQIIADTKIDRGQCGFTYATGEDGQPKLAFYSGEEGLHENGKYYLDESTAQKELVYEGRRLVKGYTGRPAMYELSKVVGDFTHQDLNPAKLQMDAIEKAQQKAALENPSFDRRLLSEEVIGAFHKKVEGLQDDLVSAPTDAGERLRNKMVEFMVSQGIKDPRLTNENSEIVFDADVKKTKTELLVKGQVTPLSFDGTNYVTEDGKTIAPDKVTTRITVPQEMLKASPAELAKTVYSAWLGQAVTGDNSTTIRRGIENHVDETLTAKAKLEPGVDKPYEAPKAGLNVAELPKAEKKPVELTIGETGVKVPGVEGQLHYAEIWRARAEQLKDQLDLEKSKTGSERNEQKIAELEKLHTAELETYHALSNPEHPKHKDQLALAKKELAGLELKRSELNAAREAGGFGVRGRLVILTALAAALLSRSGH